MTMKRRLDNTSSPVNGHGFSELVDIIVATWQQTLKHIIRKLSATEVPQVFLQRDDNTPIERLPEVIAFEGVFSLIKLTQDATPHSLAIIFAGFGINIVQKAVSGGEVREGVSRAVGVEIISGAPALQRFLEAEFDQENPRGKHCFVANRWST